MSYTQLPMHCTGRPAAWSHRVWLASGTAARQHMDARVRRATLRPG